MINMIKDGYNKIKEFMGLGEQSIVRETVLEPDAPVADTTPIPVAPTPVLQNEPVEPKGTPGIFDDQPILEEPGEILEEDIDPTVPTTEIPEGMPLDFTKDDVMEEQVKMFEFYDHDFNLKTDIEVDEELYGADVDTAIDAVSNNKTGMLLKPDAALEKHSSELRLAENPQKIGLKDGVFRSYTDQGAGSPGMTDQAIGYGIRIEEKWLTDDRKKWPKIDGVPVDVREGITEDQADRWSRQILKSAHTRASKKLKGWDKMPEMTKAFWADLVYNGGIGAIDKNPKAKAAMNSGNTVEGMILALDYIKTDGKPSEGLLKRRLNMYNQAALELTGVPVVESYEFGDKVKLKFSSMFMTDKVSDKFADRVNKQDTYLLTKAGGKRRNASVDSNFKFS